MNLDHCAPATTRLCRFRILSRRFYLTRYPLLQNPDGIDAAILGRTAQCRILVCVDIGSAGEKSLDRIGVAVLRRQPHRQIIHCMDIGSGNQQRPDGIGLAILGRNHQRRILLHHARSPTPLRLK